MIALGANNADAVDTFGNTALIRASEMGNIEMVTLLHEAKADLNVCGRYGTALHSAVKNGHTEMLKVTVNEYVFNVFVLVLIWSDKEKHPSCFRAR